MCWFWKRPALLTATTALGWAATDSPECPGLPVVAPPRSGSALSEPEDGQFYGFGFAAADHLRCTDRKEVVYVTSRCDSGGAEKFGWEELFRHSSAIRVGGTGQGCLRDGPDTTVPPVDVIVDDGTLANASRLTIFEDLFHRSLRPGGVYLFALSKGLGGEEREAIGELVVDGMYGLYPPHPRHPFAEVHQCGCGPGFCFFRKLWPWMARPSFGSNAKPRKLISEIPRKRFPFRGG